MEWLKTGFSEAVAMCRRLAWRTHLIVLHRKVAAAETTLGELGWQQADFPPEIEERIDQIRGVESEQAQIFNESAEHATAMEAARKAIAAFREESQAAIGKLEEERAPIVEVEREEAAKLSAAQGVLDQRESRLGETEKILGILEARIAAATDGPQEPGGDDPFLLREQSESLRLKRERLRLGLDSAAAALREARVGHDEVRAQLAALDLHMGGLRSQLNEREKNAAAEIRRRDAARRRAARTVHSLDRMKKEHYRLAGACLADARIPPRNQPDVLTKVLEIRERAAEITSEITESLEVSSKGGRWQLLGLLAALVIAGLLVAILVLLL